MRLMVWAAVLILGGCGDSEISSVTPPAAQVPVVEVVDASADLELRAAALAAVADEPKVRDASWLDAGSGSLLAGVLSDGTSQDGYAEYLCAVLAQHSVFGGKVRVMDVAAASRGKWVELGAANCPVGVTGAVEEVDFTKGVK